MVEIISATVLMGHQNCCMFGRTSVEISTRKEFGKNVAKSQSSFPCWMSSILLQKKTRKSQSCFWKLQAKVSPTTRFILSLDQCVKFPVMRSQLQFMNKSTGRDNLKFSGVFHWMQTVNQDQLTLMSLLQVYLCTRLW